MKDKHSDRDVDLELTEDELRLVLGGRWPEGKSKVCDVGGGCWADTGF